MFDSSAEIQGMTCRALWAAGAAIFRLTRPAVAVCFPFPSALLHARQITTLLQVAEFVAGTGADIEAVNEVVKEVRETSWAAGRTLRRKHVVLLAFAEVSSVSYRNRRGGGLPWEGFTPPSLSPFQAGTIDQLIFPLE